MNSQRKSHVLLALLGVLVIAAAACGSTQDTNVEAIGQGAPLVEESQGLPLAPDSGGGESSPIAGTCLKGEPECNDIGVASDAPPDLPTEEPAVTPIVEVDSGSSMGMPIDGGLTISEALLGEAEGIIAVKGHVYDDGAGVRLCEELVGGGERYNCDGASVAVTGLDLEEIGAQLVYHDGLTYSEDNVTLFGEMVDGVLVVDPLVAG